MKTAALVLASLFAIPLIASAQAPFGPGSLDLGKLAPEVVKTPEFQLTSGPTKRTGRSLSWLELEVGYDTKADVDELTFKFIAQIEKQLITGEVTYVNISKGRDHFAVMYVSPKALDKLTGGKPLTAASIENAWIEVNRQSQVLGKAAWKTAALPNLPQKQGFLLNKTQTPFAPLFYDRYEEVKAAR